MSLKEKTKILLIKNRIFFINVDNYLQNETLVITYKKKEDITRKRIKYKGIGYKIFLLKNKRLLYLKVGLSFKPIIKLPSSITSVKFKKGNVLFVSNNKIQLGNFIEKLYRIKPQHTYKLKGIILSYKRKKIKIVKKK